MVAPFWADVDTSSNGNVWFQECNDPETLNRASAQINDAFPLQTPFTADDTFIVTWDILTNAQLRYVRLYCIFLLSIKYDNFSTIIYVKGIISILPTLDQHFSNCACY